MFRLVVFLLLPVAVMTACASRDGCNITVVIPGSADVSTAIPLG